MRLKRWGLLGMAALMLGTSVVPDTARSGVSFGGTYVDENIAVDVSYFYDELAPHGDWVEYQDYGWCWMPEDVPMTWRPYSHGHWIYTDYGWTWASYEPWGWATYHYGRWVFDPLYGWIWVPGTTWGPAWVAWRGGYDYMGWAPLPPQAGWSVSVGLQFGSGYDYYDAIPYQAWCFVPESQFLNTDLRSSYIPMDRVRSVLPRTRDYTRYRSRDGFAVNEGMPVSRVERNLGRNVPRLRVTDLMAPGRGQGVERGRNSVGFFRPRVRDGAPRVAPREDARATLRGRSAERGGLFSRDGRTRVENRGESRRGSLIERMWGGRGRDRTTVERREAIRPEQGRETIRPEQGRERSGERPSDRAREIQRQREIGRQRAAERRELERRREAERERGSERQQSYEPRSNRTRAPRPERQSSREWQRPERQQAREWQPRSQRQETRQWQPRPERQQTREWQPRSQRQEARQWQPRAERQEAREWQPRSQRQEARQWQPRAERQQTREWQPRGQSRPEVESRESRRQDEVRGSDRGPQDEEKGGDKGRGNGGGRGRNR
jgi:hypothetical protein